jgi:hypothetical protein
VLCARRPDAHLVARDDSLGSDVITRRSEGRGHVIFSGVILRDLFSAPCEVSRFFRRLFYLVSASSEEHQIEALSLFGEVVSAVGFSASGSLYLLLAGLFSLVYVTIATFGLWGYLRSRGWETQSWTAFAIAALVASTLSVFAVGAVRGIGDRLHQVAVVDATVGRREALATAYFGIKTSIDKEIDVWLPGDWHGAREPEASDNSLRPLPPGSGMTESQTRFADPAKYKLVPASAVVDDVRVRATLKRFEGRWSGTLDGDLTGVINVRNREVADGSYITNNLGFALNNAVLIVPFLDPGGVVAGSPGEVNYRGVAALDAYELGTISDQPAGKIDLAPLCAPEDPSGKKRQDPELQRLHGTWSSGFRSLFESFAPLQERSALGQEKNALMLISTVREFDPAQHSGTMQAVFGPRTWSQDRMRQLDITDQLLAGTPIQNDVPGEPGMAVLIGFADDPGPLRLFTRTGDRDFRVLEPEANYSWSMWRIRIPIVRLDRIEPAPAAESTTQ